MHCLLSSIDDGMSVADCVKKFNQKDVIWALATAWGRVTLVTLKNASHNIWPLLMLVDSLDASKESDFSGFSVSYDKKLVCQLLNYAGGMSNVKVTELVT